MHEGVPVNKFEKINKICSDFGVEVVNNCADVTSLSTDEAMNLFKLLVQTDDVVLHGTNSDEVFNCLEARQGHCLVKESGRKVAVYATETAKVALSVAVLNRKYLRSKSPIYRSSFSGSNTRLVFKFPPELLALFEAHDPNIFSDGYVYVLDKSNFINAPDAGGEWHSESNQEPLVAFRISKEIGRDLYRVGTEDDTVGAF